ncbi:hypothetical protein [Stenotrophomonas sp. PS02301]|uniref:hypothetical protein n=1 Tax=Stenotrophomonas sp. PS02301 TaxID=2991427 RepID=UPI00249AE528|nr:hypothetical protein [Stenotrophomonas sp. PS02301]
MSEVTSEEYKRNFPAFIALSFLAGSIVTWTLLGAEAGSRADWVAAFGTWVIGIAACTLTYREGKAQRDAKYAAETRQLRVMSLQAGSLKLFAGRFLELDKAGKVGRDAARVVAIAIESRCGGIKLDLTTVDADRELEGAAAKVEFLAFALSAVATEFLALKAAPEQLARGNCDHYDWMLDNAARLCDGVDALAGVITKRIESVTK